MAKIYCSEIMLSCFGVEKMEIILVGLSVLQLK